jgi:hypothetical protein
MIGVKNIEEAKGTKVCNERTRKGRRTRTPI